MAVRPASEDPNVYWDRHFRDPKADMDNLVVNLTHLRAGNQFTDIQAAIRSFLVHHREQAEPWMYELLAVSLVVNKGRADDVNTALNYAADLAVRRQRPHELTRIADTLAIHDLNERSGQLLDLAAELEPGNATAMVMSMTLAERLRDPERMARSVEQFLSLGWPETDEAWRSETRRRVEVLAKALDEEDRGEAARRLLDRLAESEARDLFVRLTWAGDADLSLIVEEPLGASARVAIPRTVFGGALVANGFGPQPEEVYVCPRGFDGTYQFRVEVIENNPDDPARDVMLEIVMHEGGAGERIVSRSLSLTDSEPVGVRLEGGRRRKVLPYQAPTAFHGVTLSVSGPGSQARSLGGIEGVEAPPIPSISPADAADLLRLPPGAAQPPR